MSLVATKSKMVVFIINVIRFLNLVPVEMVALVEYTCQINMAYIISLTV